MRNISFLLIVILALISQEAYSASDEFRDVTCGSDIPKAIIGKRSPNERVVVTEARHKDIGLEDEGADDEGAKVNLLNKDGDEPLHCAAFHGNLELIELLLDKGANPYAKDKDGDAPLDAAKEQKQTKAIIFLLGKMANKEI
jgi:hypothetical protein